MRYGPLQQIWLYAMGHYGEFGYMLWATAGNLVMFFFIMCEFGNVLWATAANFVILYGHCGGFGNALWATARNEAAQ
jgi:hypothetical protein